MTPAQVRVALLAALSREVQPFLRRVRARRLKGLDFPGWEFNLPGGKGLLALSGMGGAAAAATVQGLLRQYHPQGLISLGFGGALTPGLAIGDVILGGSFWLYDPEAGTLKSLPAPQPPAPLTKLCEAIKAAGLKAFLGTLVTTSGIIEKAAQGSPPQTLPYPVLDLETAAVAKAAQVAGVPFLALKAVTDTANQEIPGFLVEAAREGREPGWQSAWIWVREDPRRLRALLRLWQQSRRAAGNLARALEAVLKTI